ncbi:MAG: polysaccharide biosynthesis/export family protein [Pseudomonadota bacterium]
MPGIVPADASALAGTVPDPGNPFPDYVIGPQDVLTVRVFREPDLSIDAVRVDSGGRIEMPLIGKVEAVNKTPDQLSQEITTRLGEKYLVNPSVAVNVQEVNSKRVTVEGEVSSPGVFALTGTSDLLTAIALAGGPDDVAQLDEIAVFRSVNGQKMVAAFDLARIRSGEMANPVILPGDIIVVGFSSLRQGYQDFLKIAPLIAVFRPLAN